MSTSSWSRRLLLAIGFAMLSTIFIGGSASSAALAQVASVPPIAPGMARLWFYRDFFPEDTKGMPPISMNGVMIGYALAGTSFYRDVAAGQYHLSVESVGKDYNQEQDVAVAPGMELYVKIASQPSWMESGRNGWHAGTYYVMIVSPRLASLEMAQTSYTSGNGS